MRSAWLSLIAAAVCSAMAQEAPPGVPAEEAWRDIGKTEAVCGQVVDTAWAANTPKANTYLYLERPRPEQVFTVVIPSAKRENFGESPEKSLRGKRICVTGRIEADIAGKRKVQVVAEEEDQIAVN